MSNSLRTNCVQLVREWGQKLVGEFAHITHDTVERTSYPAQPRENLASFPIKSRLFQQAFPQTISLYRPDILTDFSLLSPAPITITTIYI
jgi:hypothetical protein